MNRIIKIKRSLYDHALEVFAKEDAQRAAFVSPTSEGQAYHFTEFSGYAILHDKGRGQYEISGAFKRGSTPGFASALTTWCERLGAEVITLNCFAPAADAWAKAGFLTNMIDPFLPAIAPPSWRDEYGTPSVLYMRKHLVGWMW